MGARRHRQRGQAVVELALLMPFFLLVVVGGVVEFGLVFYNYIALQQIANNVAQYAAEATPASDNPDYTSRIAEIVTECNNRLSTQRSKLALAYSSSIPNQFRTVIVRPTDTAGVIAVAGGGTVRAWKIFIEFKSPVLTPLYSFAVGMMSSTESAFMMLKTLATYPTN